MAASTPIPPTIYLGTFVHSKSLSELEICDQGAIGVDSAGVIKFVERDVVRVEDVKAKHWEWKDAEVVRVEDGFFFPGFIDTHTHASQHANTGLFGKTTLLSWLSTYTFPMEASLESLTKALTIYTNFVSRTLSHGTTTCAYYGTIHRFSTNLLADICLERGQRALVGRVCMDTDLSPEYYRDTSVESAIEESAASIDYIRSIDPEGAIVRPIITPRFAPSCSASCLAALGALAQETAAHIQTHISENKPEIELVASLFPASTSYADVYDTAGLLTPRTILAHAVHLTPAEVQLVAARGAKISHCPASNTALTSGCAPVRDLLNAGIAVGLGTDVSGGFSPSILEECRQAIWVSRFVAMASSDAAKLSTEEALYLATRGGAAVVGLESKVGGFDVGMEFDAQMVRLGSVSEGGDQKGEFEAGPVDVFGFETTDEKVQKWVYSGDDRNTVAVWVRGRLVHRTGRYVK
ncbi:guanine deaminase [Melanomma pulvis-pyrius CBS 109.77]|uniref:Guanine deaminase n=1 Tax=Melanomma pulvis-pyrius CBS 109.77 TaxID=1314802 RepID=A0A6A6XM04_9PLEO|nr:guanine deaminase [Melanomma pulvis-pyrius CBS 109.77]